MGCQRNPIRCRHEPEAFAIASKWVRWRVAASGGARRARDVSPAIAAFEGLPHKRRHCPRARAPGACDEHADSRTYAEKADGRRHPRVARVPQLRVRTEPDYPGIVPLTIG